MNFICRMKRAILLVEAARDRLPLQQTLVLLAAGARFRRGYGPISRTEFTSWAIAAAGRDMTSRIGAAVSWTTTRMRSITRVSALPSSISRNEASTRAMKAKRWASCRSVAKRPGTPEWGIIAIGSNPSAPSKRGLEIKSVHTG